MKTLDESIWLLESSNPGPRVCIAFGTHGNERAPIDAGQELRRRFEAGELELAGGTLVLMLSNPRGFEDDERWSEGGVDLNRCFSAEVLGREPKLYEEHRARAIIAVLEEYAIDVLVDFHCTVEPGKRFLMQHPPVDHAASKEVYELLSADTLLSDPQLNFGGVSFDEWMTMRGKVGICYETGWIQDPENTPEFSLDEMLNVLAGLGMIAGRDAQRHTDKALLELDAVVRCEGDGFQWRDGVGENLQVLPTGTVLGAYGDGTEVALEFDATLVFPKKKPELVELGKPLVYLGRAKG